MVLIIRKSLLWIYGIAIIGLLIFLPYIFQQSDSIFTLSEEYFTEDELSTYINELFYLRNKAILIGDMESIKNMYDLNQRNGLWAYEHEIKKSKYLLNWSEKQNVKFNEIVSNIKINWTKHEKQRIIINFLASTKYEYNYLDEISKVNLMRIGTYHELEISQSNNIWFITREWYTDPFADSLDLEDIKLTENKDFIQSQKENKYDLNLNIARKKAVEYADMYCGAADSGDNNFSYNKEYKNYNSLGGDCANFASQIIYATGKLNKDSIWNHKKEGSLAWLNAQSFKNYLLSSKKGTLILHGNYDEVLESTYKLLPGDIIAYEKKGKIAHISVVTGSDSKGYILVNCHNTDRYRVPWDLGWSNTGIKFYLIRINY